MNEEKGAKHLKIKSDQLQNSFKLFRLRSRSFDSEDDQDVEDSKGYIIARMNVYLNTHGGKLLNCKIVKGNEIAVYFVTSPQDTDREWEADVIDMFENRYEIIPNMVEIKPS